MEHLRSKDTRRMFAFLHTLYELRDHDGFKQQVVRGIADLVSADLYAYNEISTRQQLVTGYAIWPIQFPLLKDAPAILGRYQMQHPTVAHYLSSGKGDVTKISDFMSYRQFRRTDLHNEFYRPMGIPYGIGFGISLAQDGLIGIGLHRSGKDYSERDRRILSELHPHILQAFENAQTVTRMRHETTAIHGALDALNAAIVCLSPRSTIQWTTPQADRLIHEYNLFAPKTHARLHRSITDWLNAQESELSHSTQLPKALRSLTISGPHGTVTITLMRQEQRRLLVLTETSQVSPSTTLNHLGLSPRETEILGWIVRGKSNPEIATILSLSVRTIHKHVEHIYLKVGVENRHAAISLAFEAMRVLSSGTR